MLFVRLIQKLWIALGLVLLSLVLGTLGYMVIEDFTLHEAIYMTIITVSTVGYGEVAPLSTSGRFFTIFLIVSNFGLFFYAISSLTAFFVEGGAQTLMRDLKIQKAFDQLKNHVVVCGFGRNGQEVCMELNASGKPFVVIERDHELLAAIESQYDFLSLEGDATQDAVLHQARIEQAEALICTLPKDADNVYATLTAREVNPNITIISRASYESAESKLMRAGCDYVVMPEKIGGAQMASIYRHPDVMQFISLITSAGYPGVFFEAIAFEELSDQLRGKTIAQLGIRQRAGASVIAIKKPDGDFIINPSAETVLGTYAKMIILGNRDQIEACRQLLMNPEAEEKHRQQSAG